MRVASPADLPSSRAAPGRPLLTIIRYNLPYWRRYLVGMGLSALFVSVGLCMPLVIKEVVRQFDEHTMTTRRLGLYFTGLLIISLTTGVARYFERKLIIGASREAEYDLRNDFFRHLQTLSREFFQRTQTGDLMARATNDLNYVRMFIGPGIMGTIDMMRLPFTLALMLYLSPWLTFLALMPLPFVSLLVYGFVMYMHRQSEAVQAQYSVVTSRVQENLAGARVVQAYGIADREIAAFRAESEKYLRENMKLASVMSLAWPLLGAVIGFTVLLVLWRGGFMVIRGTLGLDGFTGFVVCLLILIWPLAEFGWILSLYQRGRVGMNRINEIFAETPIIRDDESTCAGADVTAGAIRFEHVSFAYGSHPVLEDIDFEVNPGQTVALVGLTGSGKSTLVSLLTREYDPVQGRVLIDEVDARRIPVKALRAAIGYVPQDAFLFSDTVRANLTFGRPDATPEAIAHACDVAQFTETIERLPSGLDTLLGERGVNLSGGQKQRLTIARALIRDPIILILDDALSSVDTHTEELILQRLKPVAASRTTVIISHRISTIRHADLILVLDNGRIVDRGIHEDLLRRGGLYGRLYERQLLEEELEQA